MIGNVRNAARRAANRITPGMLLSNLKGLANSRIVGGLLVSLIMLEARAQREAAMHEERFNRLRDTMEDAHEEVSALRAENATLRTQIKYEKSIRVRSEAELDHLKELHEQAIEKNDELRELVLKTLRESQKSEKKSDTSEDLSVPIAKTLAASQELSRLIIERLQQEDTKPSTAPPTALSRSSTLRGAPRVIPLGDFLASLKPHFSADRNGVHFSTDSRPRPNGPRR